MDNNEINMEPQVLPEDIDIEHTQQIFNYLRDLRERVKRTIQEHNEMINSSVGIIKELSDLATTLALTQAGLDQQPTKIKRLILEFENLYTGDSGLSAVDATELRRLLSDFRRLHESQLLRDGLMMFKRAKDAVEEIESLLNQPTLENISDFAQLSAQSSQAIMSANRSLREKIVAFNKASEHGQNMSQNFSSCFKANSGLNIASRSRTNSGYEGDVESEIEQGGTRR